jgi:hypothetical protein
MTERGTFVIDRGWFDHPVFAREPFTEREAWAWLISEAAYKEHRKRVGSFVLDMKRGQVAASLRFMAKHWKWSEPKVRRFLTKLKTDAMVDAQTDAGLTVITICNYNKYQLVPSKTDAASTQPTDAGPTQDRRKLEVKELREVIVGGGGDAREPIIRHEAFKVAEELAEVAGVGSPLDWPIGWCGAPGRVEAWMGHGWTRDQIVNGAKVAMANKRDGPPFSVEFFAKPIARFIAQQTAPIPSVVQLSAQTVEVRNGRPETLPDTARRLAASGTTFGPRPGSVRAPAGGHDVRLLSEGGSERPGDVHGGRGGGSG